MFFFYQQYFIPCYNLQVIQICLADEDVAYLDDLLSAHIYY